jgi:hypothetical protein
VLYILGIYIRIRGYLHIAKWLFEIKPTINISTNNELAFQRACKNGHLHVAKWLLKIKPTIIISTNYKTASWLSEIKPTIIKFDYKNRINNMSKLKKVYVKKTMEFIGIHYSNDL